jgi:hypothetical protein
VNQEKLLMPNMAEKELISLKQKSLKQQSS